MTLAAGSKLGAYEILSPLGAGGMGEVYRARDARLSREVAIKVLPSATASDPDRRARFEGEARAASALNHPNILTIYDIGEADGTVFIAMELVEGKTLRELIAGGEPLPTRKLLDIGVQTAEGLAKAHANGIVHRDLKPENLMISRDGFVKILDFGLAKLTEPVHQAASVLPTAVAAPTQPGTVMGTAGYMSPEQASGHPVDFRSDQFSLGSILYEMAAGEKAFQRKTGAETLVAIIREEPAPLSQAAPKAPAPVRWIVERCLAKDPEERYASTKDLARDLKSLRDHLTESSLTSASGALTTTEQPRLRRRGWLLPAIAALLVGLAAGLWIRGVRAGGGAASNVDFKQLSFKRGTIGSARFAPDGQTIVYSAAWDGKPSELFSTRADSTESRPLGLPSGDILAISSAGEMAISLGRRFTIGFETTGTLATVSLGGGTPRAILDDVEDADWSPDGKQIAVSRHVGTKRRLEYPIGKVLYEPAGWVSHVRVSPDGRLIAFIDHPEQGDSNGALRVIDASGKLVLRGPFANWGVAWSPRGDAVWSGPPLTVTTLSGKSRVAWPYPERTARIADLSKDGNVLFCSSRARREMVGRSGEGAERNLTWLNWSFPSAISGDGTTVLFDEQQTEPIGIYLRRLDGSPAVRIGEGRSFAISPDGKTVLASREPGVAAFDLIPTGTGETRHLPKLDFALQWAKWFPDGRRILFSGSETGHGVRAFVMDLEERKPRGITPEGVVNSAGVSPDGKSVIALSADHLATIYPVEGGEPRLIPDARREDIPICWSADGRSVFTLIDGSTPARVDLVDIATGRHTPFHEFVPPDPAGASPVATVVVAPDGNAYVYSYRRILDDLYVAKGFK
ncbi:MAG TPA: WD40 repeat domain-containing serine/threonine protein kinase [Thermoanaerobaculia bacterium]